MSYGTVIENKGHYHIQCKPIPKVLAAIKELPDRSWDWANKIWRVPVQHRSEVERFAKIHNLDFGYKHVEEAPQDFVNDPLPELTIDIPTRREMRPYQKPGVAYTMQKRLVIMGDDMGLGKTFQAIAALAGLHQTDVKVFPALVICPSSVKLNWKREFELSTNIKAIVLNTSVKHTWPEFYRVGLAQVFIVNYESLKKYFVTEIKEMPKGKRPKLSDIKFNKNIELFKTVIIDESHRCFPYNTPVMTNKGWFNIGEIVENKRSDLLVMSMNLSDNSLSYNKINNFWENELGERKLVAIKFNGGELRATENHKIYTAAGRYKEIREIKSGDYVYLLRGNISNCQTREKHSEVLLKDMFWKSYKYQTGSKKQNQPKQYQTISRKALRMVQSAIYNKVKREGFGKQEVLHTVMFSKMAHVKTGFYKKYKHECQKIKTSNCHNQSNGQSGYQKRQLQKDDAKQSNAFSGSSFKSIRQIKGKTVSWEKGRQWRINGTPIKVKRSFGFKRNQFGVFNQNGIRKKYFSQNTKLLQIGYSHSRNNAFNRGGWNFTQSIESERCGCFENPSVELIRVESVEIYEQRNIEQHGSGIVSNQTVYDLEIDKNHNYFANGILVSNCKDFKTLQYKFTRGITKNKDTVFALTGTAVINSPIDLASQLMVINRLHEFGGYKYFEERYCSGPKRASNLKELNYKLNQICYYRRNKTDPDIKKHLPDKMRQVVICELNDVARKEYNHAKADLESYMRQYKEASDEQIQKSMKGEVMVRIGILKNISARGKLADAFDYIRDVLESGQKIVVFANLTEVIRHVQDKFPKSVRVTGAENDQQKQAAVDKFQNDPDCKLIVCNLKAAGVGITLTASQQVAFIEFGWHAAIMDQAEDRCYRLGQHANVMCTYFLGKDTIDEWNYNLIQAKREIANTVTGNEDNTETSFIDSIMTLFNQ